MTVLEGTLVVPLRLIFLLAQVDAHYESKPGAAGVLSGTLAVSAGVSAATGCKMAGTFKPHPFLMSLADYFLFTVVIVDHFCGAIIWRTRTHLLWLLALGVSVGMFLAALIALAD